MNKELADLKRYLSSSGSESANDHLVFPLFRKLFAKDKFKKEAEAKGADIFIEGRLLIELKTKYEDWLSGFYQGMHYKKKGLSYSAICVISHDFIGLWHLENLPKGAQDLIAAADSNTAPNEIGKRNAAKTNKALERQILDSCRFSYDREKSLYLDIQLLEFEDALKNIDQQRSQVNPDNFLRKIGILKSFFDNPLDAIHCFYTMLPFWDITAKVPVARNSAPSILWLNGKNGSSSSETFFVQPKHQQAFRDFVEEHYVFTNDAEGLSIDYYFSRFDEALAEHDPEYVRQHGIFFTDINLSRFALWFIREKFGEKKLSEKYIVIDPAGGSGNLISSWRRNHLKFKIVSELNPDLLKTIELRLRHDPIQVKQGYSIVPKISENKGLNFIDKTAAAYYDIVEGYLKDEGKIIDRPFAFLLNPPYKNTDENDEGRKTTSSDYIIDSSLTTLTGNDAGNERYLAFLAQILELCKLQKLKLPEVEPVVMIFTPTSWLIPRPTYAHFRDIFDKYFKFEKGFMVTGQEFFRGTGRWPVAFTIWRFNERKNTNVVKLLDLTELKSVAFNSVNWNEKLEILNTEVKKVIRGRKDVLFDNSRGNIRESLPLLKNARSGEEERQQMYDFKRSPTKTELASKAIFGGLPIRDERRGNIKTYGTHDGKFLGIMDDGTPVRVQQDKFNRMSDKPDRVWFRLDNDLKSCNKTRITNGPTDKYGYCAYDLPSAMALFTWFAISKAINGQYPVWANQFDFWPLSIKGPKTKEFYSLAYAFGLSENRCTVLKFERDNPVPGTPEVFLDNPMCPTNPASFWSQVLSPQITGALPSKLVEKITGLYEYWNTEYCNGRSIEHCGLRDEPYFKYFTYPDFVTPYSGLLQIRKYGEVSGKPEILDKFEEIKSLAKQVKDRLFQMIVEEYHYFE